AGRRPTARAGPGAAAGAVRGGGVAGPRVLGAVRGGGQRAARYDAAAGAGRAGAADGDSVSRPAQAARRRPPVPERPNAEAGAARGGVMPTGLSPVLARLGGLWGAPVTAGPVQTGVGPAPHVGTSRALP